MAVSYQRDTLATLPTLTTEQKARWAPHSSDILKNGQISFPARNQTMDHPTQGLATLLWLPRNT